MCGSSKEVPALKGKAVVRKRLAKAVVRKRPASAVREGSFLKLSSPVVSVWLSSFDFRLGVHDKEVCIISGISLVDPKAACRWERVPPEGC
jgi:hypothetical protein